MKTISAAVRYARPCDARSLSAVHEASWRGAYAGLVPHAALNAMIGRRGVNWWAKAIADHAAILVLDYAGSAVGYATIGRNRTPALAGEGEIYELYILPRFQGVGFGRHLFDAARRLLASRGLRGLVVWALEDSGSATAFHARLGGVEAATGRERFDDVVLPKLAFIWP